MRFMRRSEMTPLTYDTAPSTSLSISIFSRLVVTTFFTSRQLSRRTVSMPCTMKDMDQSANIQTVVQCELARQAHHTTPVIMQAVFLHLGVHLVVLVWICVEKPCIPLLTDEEVWTVHLCHSTASHVHHALAGMHSTI